MNDYLEFLDAEFKLNANTEVAKGQKAYMKNHFDFYGITAPKRQEIQKPYLVKTYLPPKSELEKIVKALWLKSEREYQYFGQEFAFKYIKQIEEKDIEIFEFMLRHKSWWDTVDYISVKLIGAYFKKFPEIRNERIKQWLDSENTWLQRSSLLFQLKYKKGLDTDFLSYVINELLGSDEFFINKAIGWVLREYSRSNPDWVIAFCGKTTLSNLSRKEALRLIN